MTAVLRSILVAVGKSYSLSDNLAKSSLRTADLVSFAKVLKLQSIFYCDAAAVHR